MDQKPEKQKKEMVRNEAVSKAVLIVGGIDELAELVGVSRQLVYAWRQGRRPIRAEYCPIIERVTVRQVKCEEILPHVDWAVLRGAKKRGARSERKSQSKSVA